jgi:hypothetical protein
MIHFDTNPTIYWLCVYLLAGQVILSALYKRIPLTIYITLSLFVLVAMRMPTVVFNRELNADESQMLSHAITLYQDPVYWKSADGTTIGPLDNYLLVIPKLLGFSIDYTSGRVMGLLCTIGSILFLFLTLRIFFGEKAARTTLLVPLFLLAFTQEPDFVHYSSEQLPVLLLTICLWYLSKIIKTDGNTLRSNYFLGFLAGMVPFAKLQAVPQAMAIVVCALWVCFTYYRKSKNLKPLLILLSGGLTFPLFVLIWSLANQVFDDLIDFYLLGNVIYAGGNSAPSIPVQFYNIFKLSSDFQAFTLMLMIPVVAGIWYLIKHKQAFIQKFTYIIPVTILLVTLSSIYAVTKSGNDFIHYLNFCIVPLTLLAGFGMNKLSGKSIIIPTLLLLWFFANDILSYKNSHTLNRYVSDHITTQLAQSPVVSELKKYTRDNDFMVVWGWQCSYYVEAQLAEGTAENHSERSIFKHDMKEKYKSRYLSDIQRTTPAVFLDAVGKNSLWVQDRETQGFETFPELRDYIIANYTYRGLFDDTRLYVRNDRLKN